MARGKRVLKPTTFLLEDYHFTDYATPPAELQRRRRTRASVHCEEPSRKQPEQFVAALNESEINRGTGCTCRYGLGLILTVLVMAEGRDSVEMPSFDPSPSSEAKKRPSSSDGRDEPMRKMPVSKFGSRPRFEPVHFVSGGSSGGPGTDEKENDKERRRSESYGMRQWDTEHSSYGSTSRAQGSSSLRSAFDRVPSYASDSWGSHRDRDRDTSLGGTIGIGYGGRGSSTNFIAKTQQDYTAKYDTHSSRNADYSQPQRYNGYGGAGRSGGWDSGRPGSGFGYQDRRPQADHSPESTTVQAGAVRARHSWALHHSLLL
ncbi:unnamed protein product [Pleuronectes platessa]|uniref:Uncharacterized protein n=1 Tax=Pleuronectes platessa TaxID=8262 RepID=A0A9N7Z5G0_PLEPL|nr:unnamed protein product [Pleuronectes platessa]